MDSDSAASNHPDHPQEGTPGIQTTKLIERPKTPEPQPTNEFQEVKKELTGYEKATLRWTRLVVVINLFTCGFIGCQWYEMRSGSTDTHTLAQQAIAQTGQTSDLAKAAKSQADSTGSLVVKAGVQAGITSNLTDATRSLAENAKQQLELQRQISKIEHGFARIGLANWAALHDLQPGKKTWITLRFQNNGDRNADYSAIFMGLDFLKFPPSDGRYNWPISTFFRVSLVGATTLAPVKTIENTPYAEYLWYRSKPTSQTEYNDFMSGKTRLYLWGKIRFRQFTGEWDIFTFCRYVGAPDVATSKDGFSGPYQECEHKPN